MEHRHLRYFCAVAEEANLTRAAQRLRLSSPALSQQIKALERELGAVLFQRTPTGMVLTGPGEVLLPEARGPGRRRTHSGGDAGCSSRPADVARGDTAGSSCRTGLAAAHGHPRDGKRRGLRSDRHRAALRWQPGSPH
ncbi:LysR family transcriptional regulator [Streptomyces sp. NPDC004227]